MQTIMIIGAHGATARILTERLLHETDDRLILFLRQADRLAAYRENPRVTLVDGDVLDTPALATAMAPADLIYSNAGGTNLADQTQSILAAMTQTGKDRLIFISALGAHHEVPGKFGAWNEQAIAAFLPGFRSAAKLLSKSPVQYTEIRPAWLTDKDEVSYEQTTQDEPFKGTEVSRQSVADFAFRVCQDPTIYRRASIGLNKPNTTADKPAWL